MNKKAKKIGIIIAAVLLVCGIATLGLLYFIGQRSNTYANKANVEWYDENGEEFIISTPEELYGVLALSEYYDFKGQTIKLGADIVLNEGSASDWSLIGPKNKWYPITGFAGTFDGQGHSISGLYARGSNTNLGLFADTDAKCVIKNFKILNSYFKVNGNFPIGSVAANGAGTFSNIYSDAILTSNGLYCGGLFGTLNVGSGSSTLSQNSKVSNCWFDGEIILTTKEGIHGGGIVASVRGGNAEITHCLNTGTISSENGGNRARVGRIGGLVGEAAYVNESGNLRIEDCLNVGKMKCTTEGRAGAVIGTVSGGKMTVTMRNVYATAESADRTLGYGDVGTINGSVRQLSTEHVKGTDWYRFSELDFQNNWATVEDDTPILQCFATEIPSLKGIEKAYDTSWYIDTKDEYEITTKEQLIGLSILSQDYTFEGKSFTLGADIVLNEDTSEEWLKKAPKYIWTPIGYGLGSDTAFNGYFNGMGHTISGLYAKNAEKGLALFKAIGSNGSVKNVRITNSYLEYNGDAETTANLGSVAGRTYGNINTIYSDVTLVSTGMANGGVTGQVSTSGFCTISNCWYDGNLTMLGNHSKGGRMGGGIVGRVESGQTTIEHCLVSGNISSEAQKVGIHVGGFVGYARYGKANEIVKLNIKDSLMAGTVNTVWNNCVGSIIGRVFEQVVVNMSETYAIQGNSIIKTDDKVTKAGAIGRIDTSGVAGVVNGGCITKSKEQLTGYNGYIWSILDFDNYWTVVLGGNGQKAGTPVLQSFATSKPSLANVNKMIDIKWYNKDKTSYTISNVKQLFGFAELAGGTTNFAGKTVKLGTNITVNGGDATTWKKAAPANIWVPIGAGINANQGFSGTFDGQGYTVSGLYYKSDESGIGFFRSLGEDALIKNVKVTNSYFEYTGGDRTTAAIGGIVGRSYGDVDTVYSNAYIQSTGLGNGGLIGQIYGDESTTINNSWFDGTVAMIGKHADGGQHGGGLAGRIERGVINITHCLATGLVSCEAKETGEHVGGFVGYIRYEKKNDGTTLNISDSLMAGKIEASWHSCVSASVGRVLPDVKTNIDKTYVLQNSCKITKDGKVSYGGALVAEAKDVTGGVITKKEAQFLGNNSYIYSELNFDKYWAVIADGTPMLQSFATSVPSVAGLKRLVDTSWYKAGQKTQTIQTREQLYGLADIVSGIDNFAGKTVKLGANITDNIGTVAEWKANGFQNLNVFEPIGNGSSAFRGSFDGQGYTISGLYMNGEGTQALFGKAYDKDITIKNFSLKNTYIQSAAGNNGSIAGVFRGNMKRIYSDATIVVEGESSTKRYATGGMVGYIDTADTSFSECWFDGSITTNGQATGGLYGVQYNSQVTTVEDCLVTGTLKTTTTLANQVLGGFVGSIHGNWVGSNLKPKLVIENSVFEGEIETTKSGANMFGLLVGQVSSRNDASGVWMKECYFAPTNNAGIIGWQADSAVVIDDKADEPYTGSCAGLNILYRKENSAISVFNTELGLDGSIWCDVLEGVALTAFADGLERIDISWYNKDETTYTISSKAQLYGLARLNESSANLFADKEILLGADITVNSGTVAQWKEKEFEGLLKWYPIGNTNAFRGDFNGQGHFISGLYMDGNGTQGLFAKAYGKDTKIINIGNFDLKNTYIRTTGGNNGSIVGIFRGNLSSIYSEATIDVVCKGTNNTTNFSTGGMIGYVDSADTTISNCWYAGELTTNAACAGGLVGYYSTNVVLTIENCHVSNTLTTNIPTRNGGLTNAGFGGFIGKVYSDSAKTVNIKNSMFTGNLVQGAKTNASDGNRSHIGLYIGQLNAKNCAINVDKSYYPSNASLSAFGYVDNSGKINNTTYANNSAKNSAIQTISKKWSTSSTVAGLGLNANVWKDTTNGPQLLLNGNEDGRIRIDITWFEANVADLVLMTKEQLYGFSYLNNHRADGLFRGKTVKLGADITVNTGTVDEWKANNFTNLIKWEPVGTTYAFRGNFDGQGHTISGIYMNGATKQSFFGNAYDNNILLEDFRLVNTYIQSAGVWNASVAGNFRGRVDSVYSDATIVVQTNATSVSDIDTGGIIGRIDNNTTITNCWYAGDITADGAAVGGIVGNFRMLAGDTASKTVTIQNCVASGTLTTKIRNSTTGFTNAGLGGIIGKVSDANTGNNGNATATIENSLFTGELVKDATNVTGRGFSHVGLIFGQMHAGAGKGQLTISNSYCMQRAGFTTGGYIDSGTVKVNGTSYTSNSTASGALAGLQKASSAMTVSNLNLNANGNIWIDTTKGPVLNIFKAYQ